MFQRSATAANAAGRRGFTDPTCTAVTISLRSYMPSDCVMDCQVFHEYLRDNILREIVEAVGQQQVFLAIDLSGCDWQDESALEPFINILALAAPHVVSVKFGCSATEHTVGMRPSAILRMITPALFPTIGGKTSAPLVSLELSGICITPKFQAAILPMIQSPSLQKLVLSDACLTEHDMEWLEESLPPSVAESLVHLDLSGNRHGGIVAGVSGMIRRFPSLETLVLSDASPSDRDMEAFFAALLAMDSYTYSLRELKLGDWEFGDPYRRAHEDLLASFCQVVSSRRRLRRLEMGDLLRKDANRIVTAADRADFHFKYTVLDDDEYGAEPVDLDDYMPENRRTTANPDPVDPAPYSQPVFHHVDSQQVRNYRAAING